MKKNTFFLCTILLALVFILPQKIKAQHIPQLGKSPIKTVIAAMTLQEKVNLLIGTGMDFPGLPPEKQGPVVGETNGKVPGAAGATYAILRLGIPSIILADGPAGLRIKPIRSSDSAKTFYCTAFPIGSLLASTWDTGVVKNVGKAMGEEVKEYGVDIFLAPALNIHRNPLGGRNFEYYSEDPVVSGNIAAAYINGVQSNGVGTSIKHFALNNHEFNRNVINVIAGERTIREIYLRGFQIAIAASKPWTVMSSYNKINGTFASENKGLLTNILRDEWKYKGFVMTDWFGGTDAVAQMNAGNDMLMPGTGMQQKELLSALTNKKLDEKIIDKNIERILQIILQTPAFKKHNYNNAPNLKAHALVSRTAATEGMVLLKNDKTTLPLSSSIKKIAVLGNAAYDMVTGGTGSGDVYEAYNISLTEGLNNAGFVTDKEIKIAYDKYIADAKAKRVVGNPFLLPPPIAEMDWANADANKLQQLSATYDAAIITIGRNSGEFRDRKVENDFNLNEIEIALIKNVSAAFHAQNKKTIVVLNIGGIVETASWKNIPDAILLAWLPGQEAGNAIADILSGKVNPSGKLTSTFPAAYTDVPSAEYFPGKVMIPRDANDRDPMGFDKAAEVNYKEGIDIGYRFYDKYLDKVSYAFGYGLSYTNFSISNLKISTKEFTGKITVNADVANTGKVAGKEVVQLYIASPKSGLIGKPVKELKAFAKTKLLQPNQKQTLQFEVDAALLSSFYTNESSWIIEKGKYEIWIGNSATKIKQKAGFTVSKNIEVEKVAPVLLPQNN